MKGRSCCQKCPCKRSQPDSLTEVPLTPSESPSRDCCVVTNTVPLCERYLLVYLGAPCVWTHTHTHTSSLLCSCPHTHPHPTRSSVHCTHFIYDYARHLVRALRTGDAMCSACERHGRGQHRCFADTRRWLCADTGIDGSDAGGCCAVERSQHNGGVALAVDDDNDDADGDGDDDDDGTVVVTVVLKWRGLLWVWLGLRRCPLCKVVVTTAMKLMVSIAIADGHLRASISYKL